MYTFFRIVTELLVRHRLNLQMYIFFRIVTELFVTHCLDDVRDTFSLCPCGHILFMAFQYQVRAGARADAYNDENDQVSSTV